MITEEMLGKAERFAGVPVIPDPNMPQFEQIIELRKKVTVSEEFRKQFDNWALKLFGQRRLVLSYRGVFIVHPTTMLYLKKKYQTLGCF